MAISIAEIIEEARLELPLQEGNAAVTSNATNPSEQGTRGLGAGALPGTWRPVGAAPGGSQTPCQPRSLLPSAQEARLWVEVAELK